MIDRPSPYSVTPPAPRPSSFGRLWRWFLPGAIVLIAVAILQGIVDPNGGPVWIFAAGVAFGVIGAGSLLRHLFDQGRAEVRRREQRLEDREGKRP